jgi:hypothetical protein
MVPGRQISSFECTVCSKTIETWNSAWVPTYRLVAGPIMMPQKAPPAVLAKS